MSDDDTATKLSIKTMALSLLRLRSICDLTIGIAPDLKEGELRVSIYLCEKTYEEIAGEGVLDT